MALFPLLIFLARSLFASPLELMAEILALRQQLAILNRTAKRPILRSQDRLFWIILARFWQDWRSALLIVKPETIIKWHRQGIALKKLVRIITNWVSAEYDTNRIYEVEFGYGAISTSCLRA